MGQYWYVCNLSKKEYIHPHKLGTGLKLWEQLANHPGTGAALIVLCAAMPKPRGGGDFDLEENWHGIERYNASDINNPGPLPSEYYKIAARTIGRWAGDRIALVGDYAEKGDLPVRFRADKIYDRIDSWVDVSEDVAAVIEHELQGKFHGTGWRDWSPLDES